MERDQLPLPDYDHLPAPALRDRIRSLDEQQLTQVLEYERQHGDRAPVVTVLQARLEQLGSGAEPTQGRHDLIPEAPLPPSGQSPVGPAGQGPATMNPPPHGEPAQPGKPKGDARH